jgi:hypothetical protein
MQQPLERYGVVDLLFLVALVAVAVFWEDGSSTRKVEETLAEVTPVRETPPEPPAKARPAQPTGGTEAEPSAESGRATRRPPLRGDETLGVDQRGSTHTYEVPRELPVEPTAALAGYRLFFEPRAVVAHRPGRATWGAVVRHWRRLGHNGARVRWRYAAEYATPRLARRGLWWRALAPLIAARITAGIYADPAFWRYWRSLPVVYVAKILYCLGAAAAVDSGFAFAP